MALKYFLRGFSKQAGKTPEVSCVGVIRDGKLLMGKRNDNKRFTNPGGHLNIGEKPVDGAVRELFEETGIESEANDLKHLKTESVTTPTGKKYIIHAYLLNVPRGTKTSVKEDPDAEVKRWQWLDMPLPDEVMKNLHSPKNVLLKALGLQNDPDQVKLAFYKKIKMRDTIGTLRNRSDDIAKMVKMVNKKKQEEEGSGKRKKS